MISNSQDSSSMKSSVENVYFVLKILNGSELI